MASVSAARPRRPILYLSHSYVPSRHANSIQVMRMCEALAALAGPLELFCRRERPGHRDPFEPYGVPRAFRVRSLWVPRVPVLGRMAYTALGLVRALVGPRPRLLYARDPYLLGTLAALGLCRAPSMLEVHQPPQGALERALVRRILAAPGFLRLVVITRALGERYRELFGELLPAERVLVAPDAAAPGVDAAAQPERALEPRPFTLGYAGSLAPGKGAEWIARLAERLPDLRFELLGGAHAEVRAWRVRCQAPNLHFRGFLPPSDVAPALARCDALLAPYQPSVRVGPKRVEVAAWMSPLKVFEAMAAGRPLVASDLPVVREVLRDGENALLAPPGDLGAWCERIRALQREPALGRRLAERARADLESRYTWDRRAASVLAAATAA